MNDTLRGVDAHIEGDRDPHGPYGDGGLDERPDVPTREQRVVARITPKPYTHVARCTFRGCTGPMAPEGHSVAVLRNCAQVHADLTGHTVDIVELAR